MAILIILLCSLMSFLIVYGEDNADSGTGDTSGAAKGKGFYRSTEYMYKVSVYVGLSDETNKNSPIEEFKMIGNAPVFVKPATFSIPSNAVNSLGNKIDYQKGESLSNIQLSSNKIIVDNPPPIPITNGGNIDAVKSYFGDVNTLDMLINAFADQKGTTREGLVGNIKFTIEGETKTYPPEEILPIKVNGQYQNKVSWLVVYEPVIISYLKPDSNGYRQLLAFTATEYAMAQKLGYFNFFWGSTGQYIAGMTHSALPNSIVLEKSWVGVPALSPLNDKKHWSDDRIIEGGGIGMRILEANGTDAIENDTTYDYSYRVDTDVITSVRVKAVNGDITPDSRHRTTDTRKDIYKNPSDNKAYVTIKANGQSVTTPIVLPNGDSEYVWLKWHTPSTPQDIEVTVNITGNPSARLENGSRHTTFTVKIEDLSENEPPDPRPTDTMPNFKIPSIPKKADKLNAQWGVYSAVWQPDFVWHENMVRYHSGCHDKRDSEGNKIGTCHHYKYVDEGWWLDYGEWVYTYKSYTASINADMKIVPDGYNPTAKESYGKYTMASGYGVDINVDTGISTDAPSSHYTIPQNVITYFPEFHYDTYWRLLEKTNSKGFEFKKNIYSTFNSRTHFTPLPYPDGKYDVYANVIDCWTPDGMLRMNLSDGVTIDGSVYDNWHIAPDK